MGWYSLEHGAKMAKEVYRHINWLSETVGRSSGAGCSGFKFRQQAEPLPDIVSYFLHLKSLRKSVWSIINDKIERGVTLSIAPLGGCVHTNRFPHFADRSLIGPSQCQ